MHFVSSSQPHNAAPVLELSRSLEFEHEVRREMLLQVMRWFGQVDDANKRWKMDVEKVVRQVGVGILRQYKLRFEFLFLFYFIFFVFHFSPALISSFEPNFVSGTLL